MAKGFNQVTIMGNLTKDPETRSTPSGQSVTNLSIAVNRSWTGKDGQVQDSVDYFDCVAWSKAGEIIAQYTQKGSKLLLSGRLQTRNWEDKNGSKHKSVEIVVTDFNFMDPAGGGNRGGSSPSSSSNNAGAQQAPSNETPTDDIDADKPVDLSEIPF
ncbi:single-stranded DNA-binding protein [Candidatus Saccharibacteria bacterium]|jgi:single-strand DNA-binding protein|nr:single-stranded DNA-binding protein [Candidatus Saccharibacteria bacterium]